MATIKYLVPYEVAIKAGDSKSGKPITNILYVKTGTQLVAPPAYGAPIAGNGSTATLLASVRTVWTGNVTPLLSANYVTSEYIMRSIVGKTYKTPARAIGSLVPGTPVTVVTATKHQMVTGNTVRLSGITTPAPLNADWNVVVIDDYTFSLAGSSSATAWSGDGFAQALIGDAGFLYGDAEILTAADVGGIAGDACPLINSFSLRRIGQSATRNFRSRLSLGPVPEASQVNGKLTAGAVTAWAAAATALAGLTGIVNGGSEVPGSGDSHLGQVSKQLAMSQTAPFTNSNTWFTFTQNYQVRPNCGSMLRRKPKLTASIAS